MSELPIGAAWPGIDQLADFFRRFSPLAGDPRYKDVEYDLKRALTEKMVLDWDFLPAPLR